MLPGIVIFGASDTGKLAFQMMKQEYTVLAFSDNDEKKWGRKLFGVPVIPPQKICFLDAELIITASIYHVEINRQLQGMGLRNIRVFQPSADRKEYRLLEVREGFTFQDCIRRKLKGTPCEAADQKEKDKDKGEKNREEKNREEKDRGEKNRGKKNREGKDRGEKKRKALVIAYYFPPLGGSPIQRTLKFVKYLRHYGYEPVVLTTVPDDFLHTEKRDESLLAEIPEGTQIIRIKDDFAWPDTITKEKMQEVVEFLYQVSGSSEWMEHLVKAQETQPAYILPDQLILWANACVRRIEESVDMREIDLLYSTVPQWSPHLAAYFLKQKYGIKWAADYRDPWVSNGEYVKLYYPWMTKEETALDRELENRLVREMDCIIVAGGNWADDFVKEYHADPGRIKEITNGYDEADFRDIAVKTGKNKKFTLCYNGIITYNRNPVPVIQAVNSLLEEGAIAADEMQWIFNGWISGSYLDRMLQEDRYQIIVRNGTLPHKESIEIGMQSDVMVMYGETGENGRLNYPGKFYEYLRMGRPILCFSSDDSYQAEVLRETGLGVNLDLYDEEGIKRYLKSRFESWRADTGQSTGIADCVRRYERKNLTRMLAEQFDSLFEKEG